MTTELAPATEAGVAESVGSAYAAGEPLLVQGRGSKSGMLRPVQAGRTLSTRALSGITLYSPQELIVSAWSGTPLGELEAALAAKGQQLISEPPRLAAIYGGGEPSIGGIAATNLSGPRRIAWGATRDHVMGMRFVNGTGEVIRSGGRVLKNVTGLDLCKLLGGSHGTLGVITEVTLKVLPAAERTGTLLLPGLDAGRAVDAMSEALGSPFGVSGACWLPRDAALRVPALAGAQHSATLLRIEDFAPSVEYRTGKLRDALAAYGWAELLDDERSRAVWSAVRDVLPLNAGEGDAVWRVSVRPSRGAHAYATLGAQRARGYLDWGGGLLWLAGPPSLHDAVRATVRETGGTWTLMRAPEPVRASTDVVPPESAALAKLSRRVKESLDPRGIFNPGRIYAGL